MIISIVYWKSVWSSSVRRARQGHGLRTHTPAEAKAFRRLVAQRSGRTFIRLPLVGCTE